MSLIGNAINGTQNLTLNYLPQYLILGHTNPSQGAGNSWEGSLATRLNISVNGTEIVSLSSTAMIEQAFSCANQLGGKIDIFGGTPEQYPTQKVLQLANGKLEGVNVNITIVSSLAFPIYANSETLGDTNYFWSTSSINALSNNIFTDFKSVSFASFDGEAIVNWENGFSEKFSIDDYNELASLSCVYKSQVVNATTSGDYITLYNYDGAIASTQYFNVNGALASTVLIQR